MVVRSPDLDFASAFRMEASLIVSKALVASSRTSSCGSLTRALARHTLCFCPPESLATYSQQTFKSKVHLSEEDFQ